MEQKTKNLILKIISIILLSNILIITILYFLGQKERVGYLPNMKLNIYHTLNINNISYITNNFIKDNKIDYTQVSNYIVTNEHIMNYVYGYKLNFYSKIFKNNDIFYVYINENKLINNYNFIKSLYISILGSPFGDIITSKKIDLNRLDNIPYTLKLKKGIILCLIISILILITVISYLCNRKTFNILLISCMLVYIICYFYVSAKTYEGSLYNIKTIDTSRYSAYLNSHIRYNVLYYIFNTKIDVPKFVNEYSIESILTSKNEGTMLFFTVSNKNISELSNISVPYTLAINPIINFIVLLILIYFYFKYINNNFFTTNLTTNSISLKKEDYIYLFSILLILISFFIFQFWLTNPGYFLYPDTYNSMVLADYSNANPIIITLFLDLMYKIFGVSSIYLFLLNLLLWYIGLFNIICSIYIKYKNPFSILLVFISLLANIFLLNINHIKDVTAILWIWFSVSILFMIVNISFKSNIFNKILKVIFLFSLIIGMLWRHNMIIAVYPLFIVINFYIIIQNNKKSIIKFIFAMIYSAIILVSIYKYIPELFIRNDFADYQVNHLFLLQIASCSVDNNDESLIDKRWYNGTNDFNYLKKVYNADKVNADSMTLTDNAVFKRFISNKDVKKVWLEYIIKYPYSYIKHVFRFAKYLYTVPTWKISPEELESKGLYVGTDFFKNNNIKFVKLSKNKFTIYNFLYKYLPDINTSIFIIISFILFILNIVLIIKYQIINKISLLSLSTTISSTAMSCIVPIFTPVILYRYIYPTVILTILSLITFICFTFELKKGKAS